MLIVVQGENNGSALSMFVFPSNHASLCSPRHTEQYPAQLYRAEDEERAMRDEEDEEGEEAGGWRRGEYKDAVDTTGGGAASVKGHCVLQHDEQALRGTNKIVIADLPLWLATTLDTVICKMDN